MAQPGGKKLEVKRDPLGDNIRFFLMFTVVLGHLLEIADPFPGSKLIYKTIYSFHMPIFIFLQGFYGKKGFRRFLFRWAIPYLVWQSAYIFFDRLVLGGRAQVQYLTPYWLIWYLLAGAAYQLLIPLYSRKSPAARGLLLLGLWPRRCWRDLWIGSAISYLCPAFWCSSPSFSSDCTCAGAPGL